VCSHEIIASEVNCSGSRLQPKRHGAALIQKVSVFFVGDPDVIVAKVNRFGLVGRRFKVRVHIFVPGLKSSRNHKALLSAKLNQVRLDGEPHNPSGLVFAVGVVNTHDELTKRQRLLLVIDLHGIRIGRKPHGRYGVFHSYGISANPTFSARGRDAGCGLNLERERKKPIRRTGLNNGQLDAE